MRSERAKRKLRKIRYQQNREIILAKRKKSYKKQEKVKVTKKANHEEKRKRRLAAMRAYSKRVYIPKSKRKKAASAGDATAQTKNQETGCCKSRGQVSPTASISTQSANHKPKSFTTAASKCIPRRKSAVGAPITCISCRRIQRKGKYRCIRCGDLYDAGPLSKISEDVGIQQQHLAHPLSQDERTLLSLAHNLVTAGVWTELHLALTEMEKEHNKKLCLMEEEFEKIDQEYQAVLIQKADKEDQLLIQDAELGRLLVEAEGLNSRLQKLTEMEDARTVMESDPRVEISLLEHRLAIINSLVCQA